MGIFTLCAVGCQDCRVTVWKMLAIAPGVEIAVTWCWLTNVRHPATSDTTNLVVVSVISLLALAGATALLRSWRSARWFVVAGFGLAFGVGAFLLLAMIRA